MKGNTSTKLVGMRNSMGDVGYNTDGILDALRDSFKALLGREAIGQHNFDIEYDTSENPAERI